MYITRWKLALYASIILLGTWLALPNLFTKEQLAAMPDWFPKQQVTLGLDLRGGSHLVLEVDTDAMRKEQAENLTGSARELLRSPETGRAVVRETAEGINVTLYDPAQKEAVLKKLYELDPNRSSFGFGQPHLDITPGEKEISVRMSQTMLAERTKLAIEQSLEIVRKRIDEVGVAEPSIQRMGANRIVVQLPGMQDPKQVKALLGSTAKLSFHLLDSEAPFLSPGDNRPARIGTRILPDASGDGTSFMVKRQAMVMGERLIDARPVTDPNTGQPAVSIRFDPLGAQQFGKTTADNVGKPFAIVLDGKVLSAPVIREPILGGSAQISGSFTPEETQTLSALLRAGALPAPLHVIEERTVGPDLGQDAIDMGMQTGLLGLALVVIFMVVLYGKWGMVANLALILNVILTFACLSLLGSTLTLPGIAGIILGIGMAVDANVLINERIREETNNGRSALAALDAGFSKAYSTIMDANVTTLIATVLLFAFGSGPVKGFAITMGIGIIASLFTAVTVVRVIMVLWMNWKKPKQFLIQPIFRRTLFTDNPRIRFMNARYAGIAVSIVLSVTSVILFITPGLNYGIDFKGGIVLEVDTKDPAELAELRKNIGNLELGHVGLQAYGAENMLLIRIEAQSTNDSLTQSVVDKVRGEIMKVHPSATVERTEVVGPTLSHELAFKGILAMVLASIAMLIYIWVRFEWQFALGAIATLVLDITKTVGFFALLGLDFNLTAIAALLTLIGYSVNDKVVVYDRMRENLRKYKKMPLKDLIDLSINQSLKRSIYTSATTFLAMLPMGIAGGAAVTSFALPMLFGVVIAASSSIFIAAPILLYFGEGKLGERASSEEKEATA